ncbi:hypothetical protein CFC21_045541, partial [Triticum aestivum]
GPGGGVHDGRARHRPRWLRRPHRV